MGSEEMEQMINFEPFVPFRITLSSGDTIDIRSPRGLSVFGLSLSISDFTRPGHPQLRFISLPNVAIIEPIAEGRLTEGGAP